MHILSFPFFLRANNIGAPYGELLGTIRFVSKNNYIYSFSSFSSSVSSGYKRFLGGSLFSSISRISCSNGLSRIIGYVGSVNTEE